MDSKHTAPARPLPAEAAVEPDKACEGHDRSGPQDPLPPRAGRTGQLGSRAERPSEGSRRQPEEKDPPRRGAKAPSAREAPHSDERSSK